MDFIVEALLRWWLRSGRNRWSLFHRRLFERRYLKFELPQVNSLSDIETCLGQITWSGDGPAHLYDCISLPNLTWARKKDDCDGFASLAAELLRRWDPGTAPRLLTVGMRPVADSHTVCVFTISGRLCFFDNQTLRDASRPYSEIATMVLGKRRLVCWDLKDPVTLATLEFHVPPRNKKR